MTSSAPQPTSSSYWANRTVVVTGGNGFLGTKVVAKLRRAGATVVAPRQSEADLTQVGVAEQMFSQHKPSHVIHLAARVGGIGYNQVAPAQLYLDNLMMGTLVIEAARKVGVEKTVTWHGLFISKVHSCSISRRVHLGWLPRRDQRSVRHRQKSNARSRPSQRTAIWPTVCICNSYKLVWSWRQVS